MLEYDENRTEDLVHRLISIGKVIRFIIIAMFIVAFLSLFTFFGMASSSEAAIAMALLGAVGGYFIGKHIAALITVMIEWCAQVLVGIENVIILLKNK